MFVMGYGRTGRLGFGDLLAMLGAMSFGLYSALLARVNPRFDVLIVTRKTIFWGVVLLMTYAAFSGEHFHWKSYVVPIVFCNLFFLALIASGLCFVMRRWAVNRIGAARASNYIYLVPVVNALAAVFILGEEFTLRIFISGLLILIGLAISQMKF
jgi:drug/metabolite transporter (DMT)-like permease